MNHPALDFLLRTQQALLEESRRAWAKLHAAASTGSLPDPRAGCTPHEIVHAEGTLRLLRYCRDRPAAAREPVVVCYALVNRPYILDLAPGRSVVRRLLGAGFDVYLIDWGVPAAADCSLRLGDYVGRLHNAVKFVRKAGGSPHVHLHGYCMGGTLATLYTALHQKEVRTLTLLAAPIDFSGDEALLHVWAQEKYFDVDGLVDAFGNVPGHLLHAAFQLTRPVANFLEKYLSLQENGTDRDFVATFAAVEQWNQDAVPVAGEAFREFVKCFYQRNQLVRGTFRLKGKAVRLAAIKCPVLLLTADRDHLVPPSSTLGLLPHVGSRDVHTLSVDAGHVGLAVSSRAHAALWPAAVRWLRDRSAPAGGDRGPVP